MERVAQNLVPRSARLVASVVELIKGLALTGILFIGIIFLVKYLCEFFTWLHKKTK